MADTTQLELVSPSRLLKSEPVEMVVVPGTEGNFGVLPQHAPMLSTVRPGVLEIYARGQVSERIFVAGGLAEVNPDRCTILAEEAVPVDELTVEQTEQRLAAAQERLAAAKSDHDIHTAQAAVKIAEAMVAALAQ